MTTKFKTLATALFMGLATIDQAFAFFNITPKPTPPPPTSVPELDGAGAMAAVALIVSIGAILWRKFADR